MPAAPAETRNFQLGPMKEIELAKYLVRYEGEIEVEADCELEAECNAAFDCQPDNCRAELIGGEDEYED